jgi:predicted heme/steroid binding protein
MEKFGRIAMVVVLVASAAILVFVGPCTTGGTSGTTPGTTGVTSTPAAQAASRVFTTSGLAKYNGRNGQPAYVAVDGWVYDVTGGTHWVNGIHSVCEEDSNAGQDLSDAMNEAPPGMREMLLRFPIVGRMQGTKITSLPPGARTSSTGQAIPQKNFTAAELAKYNGQNGQPAYVAADGLVYDVSGSPLWAGGKHSMCSINSTAGRDLTSALNQSPPNMRQLLQKFPVVGHFR